MYVCLHDDGCTYPLIPTWTTMIECDGLGRKKEAEKKDASPCQDFYIIPACATFRRAEKIQLKGTTSGR